MKTVPTACREGFEIACVQPSDLAVDVQNRGVGGGVDDSNERKRELMGCLAV